MAKQNSKVSSVKSASKVSGKAAPPKAKGQKFDNDWAKIPSTKQLLALVIRSLESGESMKLPTTREEATAMLGYESRKAA